MPAATAAAVPPGVRVLPVRGGPEEARRLLPARMPGPAAEPVVRLAAALRAGVLDADPEP